MPYTSTLKGGALGKCPVAQVDVVERGAGHGGGGDTDPGALEGGEQGRYRGRSVGGADADPASVEQHLVHTGKCGQGACQERTTGFADRFARLQVDGAAAEFALEDVRGALDDDSAAVDDGDALGEPVGLFEVVGGEQDGQALVTGEAGDLVPHRCTCFGVEAGRRLDCSPG
jgi:hypothetical protein